MRACRIQIFAGETQPVLVRKAQRSAELRAASYVRAHSFGKYPSDRSEFARRRHMQMTADDAWEQMEQGLQASGEGKGLLFFPVIATQGSIDDTLVSNGIHVNIPHEVRVLRCMAVPRRPVMDIVSECSLARQSML